MEVPGTMLVRNKFNPENGTQRIKEEDFDESMHEQVEEPAEQQE